MTLGYSLKNPFNLEKSNIKWQGLVTTSANPTFCQFTTDLFGLRAGFINLKSQLNEDFDTIDKLITKYAPPKTATNPSENDTEAYILAVCADTGINRYAILQYQNLKSVGLAIIKHEQGKVLYDDATINQALGLAGLPVSS